MATTNGLLIEIRAREGGPTTTSKEAHRVVRETMQAMKVRRVQSDRFDMCANTILDDAARRIGCDPILFWDTQGPIFVFDFTNRS